MITLLYHDLPRSITHLERTSGNYMGKGFCLVKSTNSFNPFFPYIDIRICDDR